MRRGVVDLTSGVLVPALAVVGVLAAAAVLTVPVPAVVAAAVVVATLAVVVAHVGVEHLGIALLAVGVATSPWNAVAIGPLKVTHAALAGAAVVLGVAAIVDGRPLRVPGWVWILGGSIALIAVLTLVWPPSVAFFAPRTITGLPDNVAALVPDLGRTSLVNGLQWLVATVALPVAVCVAAVHRPRILGLLADAFTAGAAVSALVAVSDRLGYTRITVELTAVDYVESGRQAGLSVHPNHLALGLAIALPFVVWRLARSRTRLGVVLPAAAGVVMTGGLLTTGSRAGVVGAAVVVVAAVLVEPRARRFAPGLGAIAAVGAVLIVAADPSLLTSGAESLRLTGSDSAATSDAFRAGLAQQAVDDFAYSPVHGIGFASMLQAHNIYLQLLAGGGVLLLVGYLAAQLGFLHTAWTVSDGGSGLGRIVAVAGGSFLVVGVVGNQLPDVFVSVPFALAAGLWAARPAERGAPGSVHPTPQREDITS